MSNKIIIVNGPNLNLLGEREQSQYGSDTYENLKENCLKKSKEIGLECKFVQSNVEGELVNFIQSIHHSLDSWVVINPGAFTHTSIALRDALNTLSAQNKIIEVHISNIEERENYRKFNLIKEFCEISIIGEGIEGYFQALDYINDK